MFGTAIEPLHNSVNFSHYTRRYCHFDTLIYATKRLSLPHAGVS